MRIKIKIEISTKKKKEIIKKTICNSNIKKLFENII